MVGKRGCAALAAALVLAALVPAVHAAPAASAGGITVGFALTAGVWDGHRFRDTATISFSDMEQFFAATNNGTVTAVWRGHPLLGSAFEAKATMKVLPEGGFEYSGFEYSGNAGNLWIRRVAFPVAVVPRTDRTALFVPKLVGEVWRPDWRKAKRGATIFAKGPSRLYFRCIAALGEDGASWFLDQRGGARLWPTSLEVANGAGRGTVVLKNVCEAPVTEETRRAWALPYSGTCRPFRGGWYEAARLHRAWLETTPHFKAAASRDFSKLRDISLWMWSRGGVEVSEPPVHWFIKETGLKPALDWYWWHKIPYDTCYPFFWPPRDGEDAFRAAVARMKKAGAFVQVYTNGMLWDMDDPRWNEGGSEETLITHTGQIRHNVFNPYTKQRQARMCGEAPRFHRLMETLEGRLADTGLDGVYMDMISCVGNVPCYNVRHSHAPGGGVAVASGYREYVSRIKAAHPDFILSSEEPSEEFFDVFDAQIMLYSSWERFGFGSLPEHEPVPAMTAIYRGATVHFGSFATPGGIPAWDVLFGPNPDGPDVEKIAAGYPDQFAIELSRGAIWGVQPMVHNFTMKDVANPRLAKDLEFMKATARFWHDNLEFMFDGELLPPATLDCAARKARFLAAGCYKRPKDATSYAQDALPAIFHSGWKAKDGRTAETLVNWSREEQRYTLRRDGRTWEGVLPPLSWRRIDL